MHYSEDDLTLFYYGEARDRAAVERHLDDCDECAATYQSIIATLNAVSAYQVPERDNSYPEQVWHRIAPQLSEREPAAKLFWTAWRPALAAAAVLMAGIGFTLGRMWPERAPTKTSPIAITAEPGSSAPGLDQIAERIRLAAVADHLDRSERVLLDLANADAGPRGQQVDFTAEQQWAADLIDANRLYRDAASRAGDALVASVLDDLERALLDVVHGPSKPTMAELSELHARLDAAALLFKVRVLAGELREREATPISARKTT